MGSMVRSHCLSATRVSLTGCIAFASCRALRAIVSLFIAACRECIPCIVQLEVAIIMLKTLCKNNDFGIILLKTL